MLALILILLGFGALLGLLTYLKRRKTNEEIEIVEAPVPEECCGAHAVCESDSLMVSSDKAEYYDDEDLDKLSGMKPECYNDTQIQQLEDVFYTLKEKDVAGWLRSLQIRNIQLPIELREQALLIVSERRNIGTAV